MNNFLTRTLTGIVFVAVMIFCIWWNYWSMAVLFFVVSILGLWEFYALLEKSNFHPQKITGVLFGIVLFICVGFVYVFESGVVLSILISLLFFLFIYELFRKKGNPIVDISVTLLGTAYVVLPFAMLLLVSSAIFGVEVLSYALSEKSQDSLIYKYFVFGFFLFIWSNDTFAYLIGRVVGRTKLYERISPKKTWEGTIGGVVCTQGVAYLVSLFFTEVAPLHWHVIALIVSVFGTIGDLVESMFKRSVGVKDSGNILPGHGGILDRFDAVLVAAPFVVAYLLLIQ